MKISREQVAENRQRILDVAGRLFRERGFDGVTVAEIMQAAGLTHGAFYGYFASKDELIAAACGHALGVRAQAHQGKSLKDFVDVYLTPAHRDNLGGSCLFAALGTEAVRASGAARHNITDALKAEIDRFSASATDRRQAVASWSAMVGALLLSRVVDDPRLSEEILGETRAWLEAF